MNDSDIAISEASTHPSQVAFLHRPLVKGMALLGLLGTSALVAACSGPAGYEPIGDNIAETRESLTPSSQTYMASLPSPGQSWFRPAIVASVDWPGNIEAVRSTNMGFLEHLYWAPGQSSWAITTTFGYHPGPTGAGTATGDPALCIYGPDSFMQVVVNQGSGRLLHYWRDNSDQIWTPEAEFSQNCTGSPALINNREIPTNLEVVVREGSHLKHIWRDPNYVWQNETPFATDQTVVGDPSLVQTADGRLHVIAAIRVGSLESMGHWIRSQNVWSYFGSFANGVVWLNRGSTLAAINNTVEAIVPLTLDGCPTELYGFDGSQWRDDGHLNGNGAYPGTALLYPAATTLAGSELHVTFQDGRTARHEHWRVVK